MTRQFNLFELKNLSKNKSKLIKFFLYFFGYFVFLAFARTLTSVSVLSFNMYHGYHLFTACIFAAICALWKYNKTNTLLLLLTSLLWFGAILCRRATGMVLTEREILQIIETGMALYAIFSLIRYLSSYLSQKWFHLVINFCNNILFLIAFLPAILIIGYFVVSNGHILSANILLTLFQTNYDEALSYIKDQNTALWIISIMIIFFICIIFITLFSKIKREGNNYNILILNILLVIYIIVAALPKISSNFVIGMLLRVHTTLQEYKEYDKISVMRNNRIKQLKKIIKYDTTPQLHVLVMGESTLRDHFSALGYKRKTTPWFDKELSENPNVILYPHAYSNNIQTVMSIQYALTSQNQYDNTTLADAYALTEVASAAEYDTYWISNQMHNKSFDTPIKTIADGADHQIYINDFWGSQTLTMFYDEKLVEHFPKTNKNGKTFIIFHLMGCHVLYNDRYPPEYAIFNDGRNARINSYDNCIRYNDYVLSLLYNRAKKEPHFMSFTYVSDHGEEPNKFGHDYSKFTWDMARIPYFNIFSPQYGTMRAEILDNLHKNHNRYWTSDLLYNQILHILGINNAPGENAKYDISSAEYNMARDNLTIIEKEKHIRDDQDR